MCPVQSSLVRGKDAENSCLPVAEGTATRSKEEVGGPTEVLVLEYIGGEEEGSAVQCQNPCRGKCSFHGANSQACSTHGNRHIECGELLHNRECTSPTLVAPSPNIFCYLPSTLSRICQAGEEPCTHSAATQTPEAATERQRGVEENHRGQNQASCRHWMEIMLLLLTKP